MDKVADEKRGEKTSYAASGKVKRKIDRIVIEDECQKERESVAVSYKQILTLTLDTDLLVLENILINLTTRSLDNYFIESST